jgi:ATP-dependent exoDNAse (exonuclease V) beta subunit
MYDDVKQRLFGGITREISQNFRSVRPIIDWVNATFHKLMHEAHGVQPKYIDLACHPDFAAVPEVVTYIDAECAGTKAPDVRRTEADAIASLVHRSIASGEWMVRERDDELPPRRARYGDVTVLIPNRTELHIYEQAFARAGMPYRHEGGRTFFARQEVRELVAVLRAIDDPADGVATVAALRSSAFGCSDEDLLLYRQTAKLTQSYIPDDAPGEVAAALRVLRTFGEQRHTQSLPDLIRDVLGRTRLVEFAMLQPQGDQVAANLLKVIDQARAFIDARGGGLRGFVRWLKSNIDRASDIRYGAVPEAEAAISEETDDVVRILTIHAAKGLEFSVVVFANMDTLRWDYTTVIPSHEAGGPSLQIRIGAKDDGFQTPGFEEAETSEHNHREAEDLRLLYVAATRARDRVVVPMVRTEASRRPSGNRRDTLNMWLRKGGIEESAVRMDGAELERVGDELPIWRRPPVTAAASAVREVIETREVWLARHDAALDAANAQMLVRTASSMKLDEDAPSSEEGQIRRGKAAEFGTAVHALLERIDLARPDDAAALSVAVAREYSLPGREAEIEQTARRALASEIVARARRSARLLREAPFTAPLPDGAPAGLAEGRIDLLFEEDGGIVIVDFKTDRVSAAEADVRTNGTYRTQALVYAWAAHRATGMRVREVVFLFARIGAESAIAVDDAFMDEAEALMRQAVGADV